MSSHSVRPGSLKWTGESLPPGNTGSPAASLSPPAPAQISPTATNCPTPLSTSTLPPPHPTTTTKQPHAQQDATCLPSRNWSTRGRPRGAHVGGARPPRELPDGSIQSVLSAGVGLPTLPELGGRAQGIAPLVHRRGAGVSSLASEG